MALQRRAEFGVRIALVADFREICSLMVRQGMPPVVIGLGAGILTAAAVTRLMTGLLFEVRPLDALTFLSAPLLLDVVAVTASYLPARRESRFDAIEALRYQ